ncbi:MAG: four helix bundle protein [Patescibacteria group bacterium]
MEPEKVKSFRDLRTWQEAQALAVEIYRLTESFPKEEKYGLIAQLRSAAVSVPSNIAEGKGRNTPKDFIRFLIMARGSTQEILSQVDFAVRVGYCSVVIGEVFRNRYQGLCAGINAHIGSLSLQG